MWIALLAGLALNQPGKLFLVGGGTTPRVVAQRFIQECGGPDALILVLPLTSQEPETSTGSADFLREEGARNVISFQVSAPTDAQKSELASQLTRVKGIWVPGGVQSRLIDRLGKDWVDAHLKPAVESGTHYYGTSAGAMLASDPMIVGPGEAPDTAEIGPGIGLTKWLIDTHFGDRGREARLRHAMSQAKSAYGLGLNEGGWVVVRGDEILESHGGVTVIEPADPSQRAPEPPAGDRTSSGDHAPRRGLQRAAS